MSKSAQSAREQTVSSKQTTKTNPVSKIAKPTSIALSKPNVKPDVLNKKTATSDAKPLLSPKPVLSSENKSITSRKLEHPTDSHSSAPANAQTRPISYENVSLPKKPENSSQKFVTKITVGPEAGNQSQRKNSKPTGRNNQPVPPTSADNATTSSKEGVDKSHLYSNTDYGAEKGDQKMKAVAPIRVDKIPVSGKNEPVSQPGFIPRTEVQGAEYALISKPGKLPGRCTTKPISDRPPAALPPSIITSSGQYEDVNTEVNKEYSYAQHNATDKWSGQGLARKFEQKNHSPVRPPNPYEEIDVNSVAKKPSMSWSDGAYASVGEFDDPPPAPVPVKTDAAMIDEGTANLYIHVFLNLNWCEL